MSFSKNSHSEFDLEPRTLKVEFARDIFIPKICVKLHLSLSINIGARAITFFFSKKSHLNLERRTLG